MIRVTLKEFRKITENIPDEAILCMYSDSEGNTQSTCLGVYTDIVGRDASEPYKDKIFHYTIGQEIEGIDLEKDKGRYIVILQPSL